jgi:outer membrane protein assembly factor BamB
MHIGGDGGWDYLTVDPATHRLFATRSTHTLVIDAKTGNTLGDIPGQKRSHGTAIVPAVNRGFITDGGGEGALVIFDLKTYKVLGTLKAMPDADGIIYDKATNKVLFVSGDGESLMTVSPNVDPVNGHIDEPIKLGGSPEFLAADGAGKVFINLVNKNQVQAVDLKARKVIATWPTAPGGSPVGMGIDAAHHHLFIGCRKPQLLLEMSTTDGKVLSSVPIGTGVDATSFLDGQAFASTGDGNLTVATEKNGQLTVTQTVKTALGARTHGVDVAAKKIYLGTSEFEGTQPNGRPKQKPGTFLIIEVSKK